MQDKRAGCQIPKQANAHHFLLPHDSHSSKRNFKSGAEHRKGNKLVQSCLEEQGSVPNLQKYP